MSREEGERNEISSSGYCLFIMRGREVVSWYNVADVGYINSHLTQTAGRVVQKYIVFIELVHSTYAKHRNSTVTLPASSILSAIFFLTLMCGSK